jgi:hypothetical protein
LHREKKNAEQNNKITKIKVKIFSLRREEHQQQQQKNFFKANRNRKKQQLFIEFHRHKQNNKIGNH